MLCALDERPTIFHGRWAKATDRQRELLQFVSILPNADQEFTVREVVGASQANPLRKPFTSSHISQMLSTLAEVGLVYKIATANIL